MKKVKSIHKVWRIKGYNGCSEIYKEDIPTGLLTENQLQVLLQTLTAKASLDYSEIIGALVRRKSKRSNDLLQVTHHKPKPVYTCGENPHFIASVVTLPEAKKN